VDLRLAEFRAPERIGELGGGWLGCRYQGVLARKLDRIQDPKELRGGTIFIPLIVLFFSGSFRIRYGVSGFPIGLTWRLGPNFKAPATPFTSSRLRQNSKALGGWVRKIGEGQVKFDPGFTLTQGPQGFKGGKKIS